MVRQHIYAGRGVAGKNQWQREAGLEVNLDFNIVQMLLTH